MPGDFVIRPLAGTFDLGRIRDWLDARIDAFEEPFEPNLYLLRGVPSEPSLEDSLARERRGGAAYLGISPETVLVDQFTWADIHDLRSAMDFVVWLTTEWRCHIHVNGYGTDLTEQLHRDGAESLYEQDVRETPRLWDGKLVRVGFFWEAHGLDLPCTTSLQKARRPEAAADEASVVRYLEAGRLYEKHDEVARDELDDDLRDIGPANLLTDGFYVWPADFAYYVRTYHVHVPLAFVMHAKRNGWQVPEVDVSSLPELAF